LAMVLAGSLCAARGLAQSKEHAKDGKTSDPVQADVLPCRMSGFSDSGVFHFHFNEEMFVRVQFAWKEDGGFDNQSMMEFAGLKLAMSTNITPDKDGYWTKIDGTSRDGDFHLERVAGKVKSTLDGKTKTFSLESGALLFENFVPALLSLSVRAYDTAKGGKQTVPIVVIPNSQANAVIDRKDAVERTVAGEHLTLTRYLFVLGGVEITIWADAAGKIYLANVPSQSAASYLLVKPSRSAQPVNHAFVGGCGEEQIDAQSRSPRLRPAMGIVHRHDQPCGKNRSIVACQRWVIKINERPVPERIANHPAQAASIEQVAAAIRGVDPRSFPLSAQ
jgi:hypothetical protein